MACVLDDSKEEPFTREGLESVDAGLYNAP